jgi:hypothetical protein
MAITICAILLPTCSFILFIFGFFVGRCGRKIPILDNNLPRALYRGETFLGNAASLEQSRRSQPRWP